MTSVAERVISSPLPDDFMFNGGPSWAAVLRPLAALGMVELKGDDRSASPNVVANDRVDLIRSVRGEVHVLLGENGAGNPLWSACCPAAAAR